MTEIMTIEVTDDLMVRVVADKPPYLLIDRLAGGLVRIDLHEVRHLACVLVLAGGDMAALAIDALAEELDND